jgi:hypothetical protein
MRLLAALVLLLGGLAPHVDAADGIHRCIARDGGSIYTDRPCETFDAVDRKPVAPATGSTSPEERLSIRSDCVRRTDTLLFELRRAIESDDINRLAGMYHWPGISGRGARGIMERLQRVVSRPLSSVELVFPEASPVRDDPDSFPDGTPPEDPVSVHIAQTLPGEISPSFAEDLRLVRHAGCWWVAF